MFVAAFITGQFSGAHLNPAVTIGLVIAGKFSSELMIGYIIAQILGAMLGSWLTYLFYIDHYRSTNDESKVMGSFCTSPAIRNLKNKFEPLLKKNCIFFDIKGSLRNKKIKNYWSL